MAKYYIENFIKWALTHVKRSTIPLDAKLPLPIAQCGTDPWNYLFGSVRVMTTQATINYYFNNHYKNKMTRADYDAITNSWSRTGYATDCQGMLDAYLTYVCNEKIDINAHMNYTLWCTDKGTIASINRPYVIGEAVFMCSTKSNKMTHVGWICGFRANGEPLVVEARGLAYGVVVTELSKRNWTHRGLMTAKFDYTKPKEEPKPMSIIKFEKTNPIKTGEPYLAMQKALNAAGYTDTAGKVLEEDGKWGTKSQQAFEKLLNAHVTIPEPVIEIEKVNRITTFSSPDGKYRFSVILEK